MKARVVTCGFCGEPGSTDRLLVGDEDAIICEYNETTDAETPLMSLVRRLLKILPDAIARTNIVK
jgi:hypothetical protein